MTVPTLPTSPRGPEAARPARLRTGRTAAWAALALVALLVAALLVAYLARRTLAREALVNWLESQGVQADARFETLGPSGLVGDLRIGPADAPIVSAERAEVDYRITGPWGGQALGVEVSRLRLIRPVIRASLTDKGVSLGALDDLIADFRARPSRPGAEPPEILVENGTLRLSHQAGQAVVHLDARLAEGVLTRLSGRMEATRLKTEAFDLRINDARLGLVTRDERVSAHLVGAFAGGRAGEAKLGSGEFSLAVAAPYPDLEARASEGKVFVAAQLRARSVGAPSLAAREIKLQGGFEGEASGSLAALRLTGDGAFVLAADRATYSGLGAGPVTVSVEASDLLWSRSGDGRLRTNLAVSVATEGLKAADLQLRRAALQMTGAVQMAGEEAEVVLRGPLSGTGRWTGLGAASSGDMEAIAAVKRAAAGFDFSAPTLGITYRSGNLSIDLGSRDARLKAASGGVLTLSGKSGAPLYKGGQGALDLSMGGGGLPKAEVDVQRYSYRAGELEAVADLSLATNLAPLEQLQVDAAGRLRFASGRLTFTADRCAPLTAVRFEAGENSVEDIAANLCPSGEPTVTVEGGAWRIAAKATEAAAKIPFLQARLQNAAGHVAFGGDARGLAAQITLAAGELNDMSASPRFNPLQVAGEATLVADVWSADLALSQTGVALADVRLRHDGGQGAGGVVIDTGRLAFAEERLQPADISPLASVIGSPATGAVEFEGRLDWNEAETSSSGRLNIIDLAFKSPAGAVEALNGEVVFDSLLPLTTAPGQELRAGTIRSMAPLSDANVVFQIAEPGLILSRGDLTVGDGRVRLEPTTIPLDQTQTWRGTLVFEGVELSDIVEASPFGDRVDLSAKVSGRLPFIAGPNGVKFVQGRLAADGPGRLSIRRSALTEVDATGGGASVEAEGLGDGVAPLAEAEETNAAVEFAYQAMEHLAFDLLDAEVNSLPGGRLGVLFHIRGQHAPPQRQEIRLTLGELIRRDFLNRELPLPSGTGVDLTLDTSLNLDQLLSDYARARSIDGSAPVQTPEPQ